LAAYYLALSISKGLEIVAFELTCIGLYIILVAMPNLASGVVLYSLAVTGSRETAGREERISLTLTTLQ
jgi:hypothetical protein